MHDLPARRSPGLIGMIGAIVMRALRFSEPDTFIAGAEFASDSPVSQSYPTKNSMSAMAAFPWVRACILAKADDLSGLPIRVMRDGAVVENHQITAILQQPASRTTWREWIRQAVVDYELSGNHYSVVVAGQSLLRMHPSRVAPVTQPDGQIQGYRYNGERDYAWDDVVHVRNASWADSLEEVLGEGSIRALHADLTADLASKQMTAKTAKRGRLEGIFSPKGEDVAWGTAAISKLAKAIKAWSAEGSGYLITGGPMQFESVSATPREMEFSEQRADTRDATLAVFSVPPARLSLSTANYATQAQQMRTYWESLKGGPGAALTDALTWLARRHGNPGDTVEFDYSGIEALQEGMSARLDRVGAHILYGMPPGDAYEMEGIPVPEGVFDVAPAAEPAAAEPEPEQRSVASVELRRMDMWRGFLNSVHAPSERALQLATARYLKAALKRYAARMNASGHKSMTKALTNSQIDAILAESMEADLAVKALQTPMKAALLRAFKAAVLRMGLSITWEPSNSILTMATREAAVQITTTQSNVLRVLLAQLNEGATIAEVQASMMRSHAFSATRALRIARTEATRFVNAGADQAYVQARAEGVNVQKQWLSARDGHVRDTHRTLDGQTVEVGEQFSVNGHTASFPGGFGVAGEDINCRCSTIPVLGESA